MDSWLFGRTVDSEAPADRPPIPPFAAALIATPVLISFVSVFLAVFGGGS